MAQVKIENVRISFPHLFTPQSMDSEKEPSYSASFLFEKDSPAYSAIWEGLKQVAKDKWGEKAEATFKALVAGGKVCLKDGAAKGELQGYSGQHFVSARSKRPPLVVDKDKSKLTQEAGRPYAGCRVNAVIEVWAQDNDFGKRINAMLVAVQFAGDDEAFGAPPVTPDVFGTIFDPNDDVPF